jgi:two-component system phosphate regulon sensor histidine kinase PhoR
MKPESPRAVALFSSLIVALAVVGFATLFSGIFIGEINVLFIALLGAAAFVVCFLVLYYTVEKFVYSKIKLIYKTIHSLKASKTNEPNIDMGENVLEQTNTEVITWAQSQEAEIQQLKEQETFRREFLGNLSHELKTPVFSIQGYILTLLEGGLEDEEVNRDFLERAARGVDRMAHIIEDLDVITQFESGRMELDIRKINIVELANEVMEGLEMKSQKNNITLTFKEEYEPIFVEADRDKIGQVMTNLVANSINYGNEGGNTEVRFYDMDKNILVEVSDNGLGITEEHLPRLFERFYRVDKSRSRHAGGTGLGLAIVKHIVDAHNQTINVRSTVDVGSTFSFTLAKSK